MKLPFPETLLDTLNKKALRPYAQGTGRK